MATLGARPAGFIGLLDSHIGGLFVDPGHQGKGFGKALILHALTLKQELTVEVYSLNSKACAFYRAMGFEETQRKPVDDNGLPFELTRMHLRG